MAFVLSFQNEQTLYEQNVKCTIKDHEFNSSYNPTLLMNGSKEKLKTFATGSSFSPYVTAVGLYNDAHELLAVAKFAQPVPLSQVTDFNFLIRYDL